MWWKRLDCQIGETYWYLTILEDFINKWNFRCVKCRCKCGKIKIIRLSFLINGHTKSCGCLQKKTATKHWMKWTRFYGLYYNIYQRCNNKIHKSYMYYWGRWIECLWKSFEEFKNDMYESYLKHVEEYWEKNTTIDRIDNDWNYCKDNCRWVTFIENNNNKSNNIIVEYNNKKQTLAEWGRELNVSRHKLYGRINRWWSIEDVLTKK